MEVVNVSTTGTDVTAVFTVEMALMKSAVCIAFLITAYCSTVLDVSLQTRTITWFRYVSVHWAYSSHPYGKHDMQHMLHISHIFARSKHL